MTNPALVVSGPSVLGDRLQKGSPYAIGPLSVCLSVLSVPSVTLVYSQTIGWIKVKFGMQVALGPGQNVLDWDLAPPPKGQSPQFLAHICCGQTARCIKMPLGMEVGLSLGDFVLDGDLAPLPQRGRASNF